MHKFLRAIGLSEIHNRNDVNRLMALTVSRADERLYTSLTDNEMLAEYNLFFGKNMGVTVRGEYNEENQFLAEYYVPFFRSEQISSYSDISVDRQAEKEAYSGYCDDIRVGVSLIFYLQNVVGYLKRKNSGYFPLPGTSLSLAGLSVSGKIILPIEKTEDDVFMAKQQTKKRSMLIAKARQGDEEAIESLTLSDMDTYSKISRMILRTDILSLVDTYFMPYGIECDHYTILGNITACEKTENILSGEYIWQLSVCVNDLNMDVCINEKDLVGEPEVGRRFKGNVWLQGMIHFPSS
ncbi:MAG: DUF3881 family protein [Lachnospiraceae bacterium]|nr:DUF3881 family protein [Lachnospiraceae bacterium]